jgi:hypothetical protein
MTEKQLTDLYLDYFNNFLTVEGFASHYNMPENLARELIVHAREIYHLTFNSKAC